MKSLKNRFCALVLSLALAQTSLAGIIHTPGALPPEGSQSSTDDTVQVQGYVSNSTLTAYAFEIMQTVVGMF